MFGPAGVGKTLLVRTLQHQMNSVARPFVINGPDIISKFEGDTEKGLRYVPAPKQFSMAYTGCPKIMDPFANLLSVISPWTLQICCALRTCGLAEVGA